MCYCILIFIHLLYLQLLLNHVFKEYVEKEYTRVISQVDVLSKMYMDWDDGISRNLFKKIIISDYRNECEKLRDAISTYRGRVLYHYGYPGGLGHKYISLMHSILYSTLSNNALYSIVFSSKIMISKYSIRFLECNQ